MLKIVGGQSVEWDMKKLLMTTECFKEEFKRDKMMGYIFVKGIWKSKLRTEYMNKTDNDVGKKGADIQNQILK